MNSLFKIDLHTHSTISPDGGITESEYERVLAADPNLYIAVTDHNDVAQGLKLQQSLPVGLRERIIVGEEILSLQGEVIGLYLSEKVRPGLSLKDTITEINKQGGLVYIPHPFEHGRQSVNEDDLRTHINDINLVEVFNARGLGRGRNKSVTQDLYGLVAETKVAGASASDAHGLKGLGTAWTEIPDVPTKENLVELVRSGKMVTGYAGPTAYLYPTWNRLKKSLTKNSHD